MYSLYIDKPTEFICEISVKNASLKNAMARMVVKSDNITLLFEGKIKDGKCIIPISRLKGLLDEKIAGKMNLEVIVEDTYFSPWKDDFITEEHTSVKVKIDESVVSTKPIVRVKVPSSRKISIHPCAVELFSLCEKFGITRKNLMTKILAESKKKSFRQLVNEYFLANKEYSKARGNILKQLLIILK